MDVLASTSIRNGFDSVFKEVVDGQRMNLKNNNCVRLYQAVSRQKKTHPNNEQRHPKNVRFAEAGGQDQRYG